MASRVFASRIASAPATVARSSAAPFRMVARSFQTSRTLLQDAVTVKKPVGAFRGGLFGFLLGTTLAGTSVYYYILEEYRVSNQLLSEDIYGLQATVHRIHAHVSELENKLAQQGLKK